MTALAIWALLQETRDVIHADRPVEIRVPIATENQHRAAVVTFPEEALEAMVAGWNEGDLSIERRREKIFMKLLKRAEGDVHVLGASGTLYRLSVRAAEGAYDGHVRIARPSGKERGFPEPLDLIRAMRLGRLPDGGTVLKSDEALHLSPDLECRLAYLYQTDRHRGYVIRVANAGASSQRLDPSRFTGSGLLLAGAREMLLKPGERTLLYLVFAREP